MKEIHVCVDARALPWSGIGRYLGENLRRLVGEPGFRWTLLGDPDRIAAAGIPTGGPSRVRAWSRAIFSPLEQAEYPRVIPPCDVFWAGHFNVPLLPIRARRRVATLYDLQPIAQTAERSWLRRAYARLLFGRAARSRGIFTISDFSSKEIQHYLGVAPGKIHRIYCGVDASFAAGGDPQPRKGGPYLLFVGNVKPHKNLAGSLEGFRRLADPPHGLRFVIVGKREGFHSPERGLGELLTALGDRVLFTGRVPEAELKAWYRDASALVFPSFYEGFGLPILEGLAFGLPVVTSRAASIPEVGGDLVHYCDPSDPSSIAASMGRALASGRPPAGKVAAHLARFSWAESARRHLEVLRTVGES
ncbi:MAG: glycosyltransferase family 4 protein [Spirochaetes bacterium]|nr:glycosyltransferase family 4 protein [Spirochaetota bacterium]